MLTPSLTHVLFGDTLTILLPKSRLKSLGHYCIQGNFSQSILDLIYRTSLINFLSSTIIVIPLLIINIRWNFPFLNEF